MDVRHAIAAWMALVIVFQIGLPPWEWKVC